MFASAGASFPFGLKQGRYLHGANIRCKGWAHNLQIDVTDLEDQELCGLLRRESLTTLTDSVPTCNISPYPCNTC